MSSNRVRVGIVGLGRWAKVLARAARGSDALQIVAGYSRSEKNRAAFPREFGVPPAPDLASMLAATLSSPMTPANRNRSRAGQRVRSAP